MLLGPPQRESHSGEVFVAQPARRPEPAAGVDLHIIPVAAPSIGAQAERRPLASLKKLERHQIEVAVDAARQRLAFGATAPSADSHGRDPQAEDRPGTFAVQKPAQGVDSGSRALQDPLHRRKQGFRGGPLPALKSRPDAPAQDARMNRRQSRIQHQPLAFASGDYVIDRPAFRHL